MSLGEVLSDGLSSKRALTFIARSRIHPWQGTFADVLDLSRRVAGTLTAWGIGPGDVVAFQLPNWLEAAATFYASTFIGATVAPIVHFYGAREVDHILRQSEARLLITADRFGHVEHLAALEQLRADLPALEQVAVVCGEVPLGARPSAGALPSWARPFADLAEGSPIEQPQRVDPRTPALVAYTSGTTSVPKGVVHSHRTIGAEIRQLGGAQPSNGPRVLYGAPVGHGIGMLGALLLPVYRGEPINMIDVWDPTACSRS